MISNIIQLAFQSVAILLFQYLDVIHAECTDIYGRSITPNTHFIPGPDICQLCVCDNTSPKWCKRVLCSPPQNCKSFVMGSSCCDYSCLDNTLPSGELRDEIDRRFLITIATAFLILTVLLFVIHKLRHRSVHGRIQNRQLNEDRRSIGSIGFITGSIGYLNLPNSHHFDDHPLVHFPIYKPNGGYYPRGEAPPPYEEAMADTTLSLSYASQFVANERTLVEQNSQRRRSNATGISNFSNHLGVTSDGNYVYSPHSANNSVATVENAVAYNNCITQHRTIPLPLCLRSDQGNTTSDCSISNSNPHERACSHKRGNSDVKNETTQSRTEIVNYRKQCSTGERRNTCPQFRAVSVCAGDVYSQSHRTLPLSASLSSPLPSSSHSKSNPVSSGVASFSSDANICSVKKEQEQFTHNTPVSNQKNSPQKNNIADKKSVSSPTRSVSQNSNVKEMKLAYPNGVSASEGFSNEIRNDNQEAGQYAEDYYAECENCNINVGVACEEREEYFTKQETMTLQRKLYEASAAKGNDQVMKVSLTLPTNSKTRRCSKNRNSEPWNSKDSSFKSNLEYVSSEGEEELVEEHEKEENLNQVIKDDNRKSLESHANQS